MIFYFIRNSSINYLPKNISQNRTISNSLIFKSDKVPKEAIPKNLLEEYHNAHLQPKGQIYDKRPFKVKLEANKKYAWCCCGHSKSQPFCDGTHQIQTLKINIKPIFVKVAETKEYWLCNCKQTLHRPFCDGTHKKEEIQSKLKYFKT